MIDPRCEAVLIQDQSGRFQDQTRDVSGHDSADGKVGIVFNGGRRYAYRPERVSILAGPEQVVVGEHERVEVNGAVWSSAVEVCTFSGSEGAWSRVFYRTQRGEDHRCYPAAQVRVLNCPPPTGLEAGVRDYWNAVVAGLPAGDPLRRPYERLEFIHPESVLRSYLSAAPIRTRQAGTAPIFPFRCNLSQRAAVDGALTHDLSVIEGPPGTGKTETILNLIANVVVRRETVAVVSHTNAAVDNVQEKLAELGFGHVLANLGNKDKQAKFFAGQTTRNEQVRAFAAETPENPDPARLAEVDDRLRRLQRDERRSAELRQEVEAYRLELRHFEQHLRREELPDLEGLPLLRRSSARVLDYLAESDLERNGARPGLLRRIRKYFKYGSLRGIDPGDTDVVVRLQRAYYEKRIAELDEQLRRLDDGLERAEFGALAEKHRDLSIRALRAELGSRYRNRPRKTYRQDKYKRGNEFQDFLADYPVVLSTCHSLADSIASGVLLDYLIIDEASQVDPIVAGLALACCRNLVVVGDARQLAPIAPKPAEDLQPPSPAYDCRNSLLDSLREIHGDDALPRTLLREHYRCSPTIIGFCNKKFYDNELIPYTSGGAERSMLVWRTAEGNHMRKHREGGRSNQREVDVIEAEVIPQHRGGIADADIGVTTPYRLQSDKAGDVLDGIDVNTVHKFQGRQKEMVVLTTVLDETRYGRTGLPFVDEPKLINVAVSRAKQRFVLVTNHDMMPRSRHIRDLVGYIRYQDLGDGVADSSIISIFDLLYQDFSQRLEALRKRILRRTEYPSENIAWTVLGEILGEEGNEHLTAVPQVLLKNLFPDQSRLTQRQRTLVKHRSSVDFVVYNRVTNQALLAIEVDGFKYHEDNPAQLERDGVKDAIFREHDMPILRLPTTGSREQERIRRALADAADHWATRG